MCMKAKDFMNQLKKIDCMIENKLVERQQWKSIATGTTAQMGGERVQTSSSKQKMADAVGRYTDIEREVDMCIDRLVDTKKDVIRVIEKLELMEYDILHKHYVQYITLGEIGRSYGKSKGWAASVNGRALKNVQKILDEREEREKIWQKQITGK